MNRSEFLRMIESSGPSDRQAIIEVNELIEVFPYFQSAYMLLLKGLRNTSDVKFDNQLRTCAIHVADREVLYYLLKKEEPSEVRKEAELAEETKPEELPHETAVSERGMEAVSNGDTQQTVIDSAKNSEELINEIEKESASAKATSEHPVMISTESGYDGSDATVLIIDEESGSVEEKVIYMDPGFSVSEDIELLELEPEDQASEAPPENSAGEEKTPVQDDLSRRQQQLELIDKFIIANPRIEPIREKSDRPVEDISKPFTEERGGFVTETLAKIYINQGYYSRAIDIYEKLSLKFPEKSSYFASQIEKVKDLIKK